LARERPSKSSQNQALKIFSKSSSQNQALTILSKSSQNPLELNQQKVELNYILSEKHVEQHVPYMERISSCMLQNSLREVLLHLERAPLTRILPNLHLSTMTMNYGLLGQVLVVSEEPDTMHKSAGVGAERKPLSFHMNKKTVILEQEVEISQPMHQPLHQSTDHEQMAEAEISHEQMAEAEISHEQKAEAEISHEQKAEAEAEAVCDEDEPLECGMALPEMKPEPLRKMAAPDLRPELRLNDDGSADAVYPDGRVEPVDPPGTHNKIAELDICEDDPPPSIPQVCGGVSSGDHNGQAAQDIVTELRSGVGAASLVASSLTVCIICRILPEEE